MLCKFFPIGKDVEGGLFLTMSRNGRQVLQCPFFPRLPVAMLTINII